MGTILSLVVESNNHNYYSKRIIAYFKNTQNTKANYFKNIYESIGLKKYTTHFFKNQ